MILILLLFCILVGMVLFYVFGITPSGLYQDIDDPLNLFMFQPPNNEYPPEFADLRVPKPRNFSVNSTIPCKSFIYPEDIPQKSKKVILYSHGNGENLLLCSGFLSVMRTSLQMDIITWDYSGYGDNPASPYERTPQGINESLSTIYEYMVTELGYSTSNIYLWGYSLGTGPTLALARELTSDRVHDVPGVITMGAYAGIKHVVKDIAGEWVSDKFTEKWDSLDNIKHVNCPILLIHGSSDKMIKPENSELLHKANERYSELQLLAGGHTTMLQGDTTFVIRDWMSRHKNAK